MSRGEIRPTGAGESVFRAMSMVGYVPAPPPGAPRDAPRDAIKYRLEAGYNGGVDPYAAHPASWSYGKRTPTCDCTGLVCWALGFDRKQPSDRFPHYGGYINTDSALLDAESSRAFFEPREFPVVGDVVIYGGKRKDGKRVKVGHWGIVVLVHKDFDPGNRSRPNWDMVRVVDCSYSMSKKTGAAVHERGARVWARRGRFLRYVRAA